MATITGTNVNFVKVNTMSLFNDLTKADGTIYFIVSEKKIYLDGVFYGFNDDDGSQFLKLIGGEMSGNIDMVESSRVRFGDNPVNGGQIYFDEGDSQFKILGQVNAGRRAEVVFGDNAGLEIMAGDDPLILGASPNSAIKTHMEIYNGDVTLYSEDVLGNVMIVGLAEAAPGADGNFAASLGWVRTNVINKRGSANGFASLDGAGLVPANQLPSYVDDVVMYATEAQFPSTGEAGKIYVAEDTNRQYRWTGSAYTELYAGVVLGETAQTAYRGDRGKIAYDHSLLTDNPHSVTKAQVGLSAVQNYGLASKAQAEAGTVNTVYMTPLRTKEAIETLAPKLSWTVVA